jgi:VWFA-related protein
MTRQHLVVLALLSGAVALPDPQGGAAGAGLAPGQDQRAVYSARVEAIRVDALVTDKGKTVRDLGAGDFDVSDNGVPQQVDLVSFDQIPLNVVMALDMSSSLTQERLVQLKSAGAMLVDALKPADQAAVITFAEAVTQDSGLTANLQELRSAIATTRPPWGTRSTALIDAAFSSLLIAESDVGRSLVVVFSDGVDTISWLRSEDTIDVA